MLLEAPAHEPPRPLTPGAFLRGEFEVRDVLVRGFTNVYLALGGDYVRPEPKLIAEREILPARETVAPSPTPAPDTIEAPAAETDSGELLTDEAEWQTGAESGALSHEANIFDAILERQQAEQSTLSGADSGPAQPQSGDITFSTDSAQSTLSDEKPSLFATGESWEQEGRQYLAFPFENTTSLQDYREPTNDDRYLQMLGSVAEALQWSQARGEVLDLSHDLLRVDENGGLKYFGFSVPASQSIESVKPLEQLHEINEFLLKHVFANSGTMRLDDQFAGLPLSEEVKSIARRIDENEFASLEEAAAALKVLCPGRELRVRSAMLTDKGRQRELNEDSGMIIKMQRGNHLHPVDWELYVVADGMGGHEGGEVASDLTIRTLSLILTQEFETDWNDNGALKVLLARAIDAVNQKVVALTEDPKYRASRARPGSTLTFALRLGARVFVGNVGDSRAYLWDGEDGLQRISKDHSYVQTLIDAGSLSEEDAWDHPEGSIITAHIGDPKGKTRDIFLRRLRAGDKLLLVSDGVVDMLRDRDIAPFLQENDETKICRQLVDASNEAGGADNITVVCVICE
jgi:protein phosphatase